MPFLAFPVALLSLLFHTDSPCSRRPCDRAVLPCYRARSATPLLNGGDDALDGDYLAAQASRRLIENTVFETDEGYILSMAAAWTLLFNAGTDNEGIYSRHLKDIRQDLVLLFEDQDDADRYAAMLAATDFPTASSVKVETRVLVAFCEEGGHLLGMVRRGTLVVPPEESVATFDWSPGVSAEAVAEPADMSSEQLDTSRQSLEALFVSQASSSDDGDDAADDGK